MRIFVLLCFISCVYPCTDFVVQAQDGSLVNGRSLEFAIDLKSKFTLFPRGQKHSSQNPSQKNPLTWTSKYGHLSITCLGLNLVMDGMNEKGLTFGYLWLPGAEYPRPDAQDNALDFVDFGAWALGNFSSVPEVKEALRSIVVWGHAVPPLPGVPPVHVAMHDALGNHLVVEFINGKMLVHDNPNTVLTNAPSFPWHLTNLANYLNLNALNAAPIHLAGSTLSSPGQGSGFLGMPGDWTPPSRFVRTTTLIRFAKQAPDAASAVNLAEHLLNAVDIPLGTVRAADKSEDYTQWTVVKDLTNKIFYFRSYYNLALKKIDLTRLNFDKPSTKTIPLTAENRYIDLTSQL